MGTFCISAEQTNSQYCGNSGNNCRACSPGQGCVDAGCTDIDAGRLTVGSGCTVDSDCTGVPFIAGGGPPQCKTHALSLNDNGQLEPTYTYPGGVCTRRCSNSSQCGAGAVCQIYGGSVGDFESVCQKSCGPGNSCRAGYSCRGFGGVVGAVCLVIAPDGGIYNWDAGAPAADNVIGGACSTDSQCKPPPTGTCQSELRPDGGGCTGWAGGSCFADCSVALADEFCGPTTGACVPFTSNLVTGPEVRWSCLRKCDPLAANSGCRPEYWCFGPYSNAPNYGYCTPRCTNPGFVCSPGYSCNANLGRCE